jgi:exodeoxyribonuclease-1
LQAKLQAVFDKPPQASTDSSRNQAEEQLYHNFLPPQDKPLLEQIRTAKAQDFQQYNFCFSDQRYNQLLFNYRARFFPESLSAEDQAIWAEDCRWRLTDDKSGYMTIKQHKLAINNLLADPDLPQEKIAVLQALLAWNTSVATDFGLN